MDLTLEQRIARLEDIERIKLLISNFARGADARCDPQLLRPLFTDDAVFDIDHFGTLEGGDSIVEQMHANVDLGFNWTLHFLVSPTVAIEEDPVTANCFFYLWEAATHRDREDVDVGYWIGGWYDAVAVKADDGVWRFKNLKLSVKLMSPTGGGWQPVPESFDDLG